MHWLDLSILILYVGLLIGFGFYRTKQSGKDPEEFLLAGRKLSLPGFVVTLVCHMVWRNSWDRRKHLFLWYSNLVYFCFTLLYIRNSFRFSNCGPNQRNQVHFNSGSISWALRENGRRC